MDAVLRPMTPDAREDFRSQLGARIGTGILAYGLAEGRFCPECGLPLMRRLLEILTGCKTCDDVITRHRCTRRPALDKLPVGESWKCPDCLSIWTATEEERPCEECANPRQVKTWAYTEGSQVATAPRRKPFGLARFRDNIPRREFGPCYRMRNGSMVHVKPGCRCPR